MKVSAYGTYEEMKRIMFDTQQYRAYMSPATVDMIRLLITEIERLKEELGKGDGMEQGR